jgi:hypothetical protein
MFDVVSYFHLPHDTPLQDPGEALDSLEPAAKWLGEHDETLKDWFLGGDSFEEAQQYQVFVDGANGQTASKAVLKQERRGLLQTVVFLWNGEDSTQTGASLSLSVSNSVYPTKLKLSLSGPVSKPRIGDWRTTSEFIALLAVRNRPLCITVYHSSGYFKKMAFKDRPGVGWMILLPRVLTQQDVPEARAVVPVVADKKQFGTILVSVTDAIFDHRNEEHVAVARAIEARLVSNDWLPTWEGMIRQDSS